MDSWDRKSIRWRILKSYVRNGQWPPIEATLETKNIFAGDQASYAVASSLVEYLLTLDSRAAVLDFAVEGHRTEWNRALQRKYGLNGVSQLQKAWQRWVTELAVHEQPKQVTLGGELSAVFAAGGLLRLR